MAGISGITGINTASAGSSSTVSTLFSSLNTSQGSSSNSAASLGFDVNTYGLLKSGAYSKVLKKYYSEKNHTELSEEETTKLTKKIKNTADAAGDLVGSFNGLRNLTFSEETKEKDAEKIKAFVDDYNKLIENGTDSVYSNVAQKTEWLKNLTDENDALLKNAGISIDSDGKLSFDKDAFMKADTDSLKDVFTDPQGWASKAEYKAEQIYSLALTGDSSANSYTNAATYNAGNASSYNTTV